MIISDKEGAEITFSRHTIDITTPTNTWDDAGDYPILVTDWLINVADRSFILFPDDIIIIPLYSSSCDVYESSGSSTLKAYGYFDEITSATQFQNYPETTLISDDEIEIDITTSTGSESSSPATYTYFYPSFRSKIYAEYRGIIFKPSGTVDNNYNFDLDLGDLSGAVKTYKP